MGRRTVAVFPSDVIEAGAAPPSHDIPRGCRLKLGINSFMMQRSIYPQVLQFFSTMKNSSNILRVERSAFAASRVSQEPLGRPQDDSQEVGK